MSFSIKVSQQDWFLDVQNSSLIPGYEVYTQEFDEEISARELIDWDNLLVWDRYIWYIEQLRKDFQLDEGCVEGESNEFKKQFKASLQKFAAESKETLGFIPKISFLMDNSWSLRWRPAGYLLLLLWELSAELEEIWVDFEVLGYTTKAWKWWKSREKWLNDWRPSRDDLGKDIWRLNDLRHVVFKGINQTNSEVEAWYALLLKEWYFKENIDWEALEWAMKRQKKQWGGIIVHISDGAPIDDSTLSINPSNFLEEHLREVLKFGQKNDIPVYSWAMGYDVSPERYPYAGFATMDLRANLYKGLTDGIEILQVPEKETAQQVHDILCTTEGIEPVSFTSILESEGVELSWEISNDISEQISPELLKNIFLHIYSSWIEDHSMTTEIISFLFSDTDISTISEKIEAISHDSVLKKWLLLNTKVSIDIESMYESKFFPDITRLSYPSLEVIIWEIDFSLELLPYIPSYLPTDAIKNLPSLYPHKLEILEKLSEEIVTKIYVHTNHLSTEKLSIIWKTYFTHFESEDYFNVRALMIISAKYETLIGSDWIVWFLKAEWSEKLLDFMYDNRGYKISDTALYNFIATQPNNLNISRITENYPLFLKLEEKWFSCNSKKRINILNTFNSEAFAFYLAEVWKITFFEEIDFNMMKSKGLFTWEYNSEVKKEILGFIYWRNDFWFRTRKSVKKGKINARDYIRCSDLFEEFINSSEVNLLLQVQKKEDIFSELWEIWNANSQMFQKFSKEALEKDWSFNGKNIDKRSLTSITSFLLIILSLDYNSLLSQSFKKELKLEQDILKKWYDKISQAIDLWAWFFKDFHVLESFWEMKYMLRELEDRLNIVSQRALSRREVSPEDIQQAKTIIAEYDETIDILTCEKDDFISVFKRIVLQAHPDVSERGKQDDTHIKAITETKEIVFKARNWKK